METKLTTELTVRPCVAGDADALSLVAKATFLETFAGVLGGKDIVTHCERAHSRDMYQSWLHNPQYALWLVEIDPDSAPVGYMVVGHAALPVEDARPSDLELKRIYLLSKYHGSGIGKKLVADAMEYCRNREAGRLLLGVFAHNDAAKAFYERMGFRVIGTRQFTVGGRGYDDDIMAVEIH